ncbi:MAG: sulfatase-like hydrolase/transferase [Prolixibacteraceae bacterium]|nr:sulfatase-like hydrolase/transferase [Prolixibacteraceae bacterium]
MKNRWSLLLLLLVLFSCIRNEKDASPRLPNIILLMADDMGWGDVGFNGNKLIKTPALDKMAHNGLIFTRFYSAAPVCSPTRGSCLTGRNPFRYGVFHANVGKMRAGEVTLAEFLKEKGYATGHFGKWHLGTLTNDIIDANRGGRTPEEYSPPWDNGFDVCFSTESKVPTWNPMITPGKETGDIGKRIPGEPFGTYYWTGPEKRATENLEGDDSRIIMDRVIPFVEKSTSDNKPFFAVIWFHTPHLPVLTGERYRNLYLEENTDIQNFYGAISAMDDQIGRLMGTLKMLHQNKNTLLFFTSDNGPEGKTREGRTQGSTAGFRGRKRSLYEGGVRVPGFVLWPKKIKGGKTTNVPLVTSDYFPTILDVLGKKNQFPVTPIDGISMVPVWNGKLKKRPVPIGFQFQKNKTLTDNRFKLVSINGRLELYDILEDPFEVNDISAEQPEMVRNMKTILDSFVVSCEHSCAGSDYSN